MAHAHPIEIIWALLALGAVGGSLHVLYLAIEDKAIARYAHERLKWSGTNAVLEMATINIWSEFFRFMIACFMLTGAIAAIFSAPGGSNDLAFFPQTLTNIIVGGCTCFVLITWAMFDLRWRKAIQDASRQDRETPGTA